MSLTPKYSRWQREAIVETYTSTRATAAQVAELAAAGTLEHPSGSRLGAFEIPESTVRSIARRALRKQAATQAEAELLEMPPRTAVEILRRRLITGIDAEINRMEIEQAEGRPLRGEQFRQVARAVRELASIPGPSDPRPLAPGAKVNEVRDGSETRGGLAGKILAASRAGGSASRAT